MCGPTDVENSRTTRESATPNAMGRPRFSLQASMGEALALVRQAGLLPRDVLSVMPIGIRSGDHVVVFIHGFMASAGVLRPLRDRVEAELSVRTAALSYAPGVGVERLKKRLSVWLDVIPEDAHITFVGHSMGGIVARCYALTSGDRRVRGNVSLASPFGGVAGARRVGLEDLEPGAQVLRSIRAQERPDLPHAAIYAAHDNMVGDPQAHITPDMNASIVEHVGHNGLLYSRAAAELVVAHLRAICQSAGPVLTPRP